mmetsp:Transcript_7068/g.21477  ORF Transcript_7068/g.21477 Transcript_7068/m.21477 type:complete len:218 (-) Transcript_7068:1858-2511(-)
MTKSSSSPSTKALVKGCSSTSGPATTPARMLSASAVCATSSSRRAGRRRRSWSTGTDCWSSEATLSLSLLATASARPRRRHRRSIQRTMRRTRRTELNAQAMRRLPLLPTRRPRRHLHLRLQKQPQHRGFLLSRLPSRRQGRLRRRQTRTPRRRTRPPPSRQPTGRPTDLPQPRRQPRPLAPRRPPKALLQQPRLQPRRRQPLRCTMHPRATRRTTR